MNREWHGKVRIFKDSREFELTCAGAAADGIVILCKTARLARRILHVHRTERIGRGERGWSTPDIRAFAGWLRGMHGALWNERRPLSRYAANRLWHEAMDFVSIPGGLEPGPSLYRDLQSSLEILLENGLEPCGRETGHKLADFRRLVTNRFLDLVDKEGLALWTQMFDAVRAGLENGELPVPLSGKVVLAGFDILSPQESGLFASLEERASIELWRAGRESDARVSVYATPEQECAAVCAEILKSWNSGCRNIGLVFLDGEYFSTIKRALDELAGDQRPEFEKAIRYNLTRGAILAAHPLFQTAVLPLRAVIEPLPGPLLASLFISPYIDQTSDKRHERLKAVLWDTETPPLIGAALKQLRSTHPVTGMMQLASRKRTVLREWLGMLLTCLTEMGFPRLEGIFRTRDMLAMQHLEEIIKGLSDEAGAIETDAAGALAWLTEAAESVIISEKTSEITGIQVMNLAESRGLAFEKLWVVGAHGHALPGSVRDLPLLDPGERKQVADACADALWERARRALTWLSAAAPDTKISRAVSNGEDDPYLPCPLLPDEQDEDGRPLRRTLDLWKNPPDEWFRAAWLRKSRMKYGGKAPLSEKAWRAEGLDDEISVVALRDVLACPFMFFCGHILNLDKLEEPGAGIDPAVRGRVIHAILKTIVDELPARAPGWPDDGGEALAWAREAADREISKQPDDLFWRVERIRLLGTAGDGGVLDAWLEAERERARDSWHFAGTELEFTGLQIGPIKLRGRVDRIDHHMSEGFAVWDYKTGETPGDTAMTTEYSEPQLPAYVLALRRGLLGQLACRGDPEAARIRMGYIKLKTAADVKIKPVKKGGKLLDWDAWAPGWERATADSLKSPAQGLFPPAPSPAPGPSFSKRKGSCRYCEFYNICGYFELQDTGALPRETDDEEGVMQ